MKVNNKLQLQQGSFYIIISFLSSLICSFIAKTFIIGTSEPITIIMICLLTITFLNFVMIFKGLKLLSEGLDNYLFKI